MVNNKGRSIKNHIFAEGKMKKGDMASGYKGWKCVGFSGDKA